MIFFFFFIVIVVVVAMIRMNKQSFCDLVLAK